MLSVTALAGLAVGITSCSKDALDDFFSVVITQSADAGFVIPEIPLAGVDTPVGQVQVYFNLDSLIREQTDDEYNINTIDKVFLEEMTLTLNGTGAQAPDSANNLSNLEKGTISFSSSSNTVPMDFDFTVPDTYATTLSIPVDQTVDLKSYVTGNMFVYGFSGKARRITTHELGANLKMKFKIEK
jgi:hypothetical protein